MGRRATATDAVEVVRARRAGRSDRQIATELGLTKGQVCGMYWRATSAKYAQQMTETSDERLARLLSTFSTKHGAAAARAVVIRVLGDFSHPVDDRRAPDRALRRFSWEGDQ